ncbi:hypothetical protein DFH08DRAFT_1085721 [Mycena albidolilacea]|uniref:Uncharacterized protein n=1 Tax=Mycena albidolilacea TaxID=1033008 RepID=A0AAD6ZHQ3_9AGAR|nr:hypothetical protein DFH08DRAFT_1085721 [Mycena albidolilacea]
MRRLYDTFENNFPDKTTACAFRFLHPRTILNWGQTPVYEALHKLVHTIVPIDHFILTSNIDRLFHQSLRPRTLLQPPGHLSALAAMQPYAPGAYFPIQLFIDRALPHLANMCFLSDALFVELHPRFPHCGLADVFLTVRAEDWFLMTQAAPRAMHEVFFARRTREIQIRRQSRFLATPLFYRNEVGYGRKRRVPNLVWTETDHEYMYHFRERETFYDCTKGKGNAAPSSAEQDNGVNLTKQQTVDGKHCRGLGDRRHPAYDVLPGFENLPGCAWSVWGAEDQLGNPTPAIPTPFSVSQ